eukprot:4736607-Amphidinium_carterae.1
MSLPVELSFSRTNAKARQQALDQNPALMTRKHSVVSFCDRRVQPWKGSPYPCAGVGQTIGSPTSSRLDDCDLQRICRRVTLLQRVQTHLVKATASLCVQGCH